MVFDIVIGREHRRGHIMRAPVDTEDRDGEEIRFQFVAPSRIVRCAACRRSIGGLCVCHACGGWNWCPNSLLRAYWQLGAQGDFPTMDDAPFGAVLTCEFCGADNRMVRP